MTSILDLPDDVVLRIYSLLDLFEDRETFNLTCKWWLKISRENRQSLCLKSNLLLSPADYDNLMRKLLAVHKNLTEVRLSCCFDIQDRSMVHLSSCGQSLTDLHMDQCFNLTDVGLATIAAACANLIFLNLSQTKVGDDGLLALSDHCQYLQEVNISLCKRPTDFGIFCLIHKCSKLCNVTINSCPSIRGDGFDECSNNLAVVEANKCSFSDIGIKSILSGTGLVYLSIANIKWSLKPGSLGVIGEGLGKNLRTLILRDCVWTLMTTDVIQISKGCPLLLKWNLSSCHNVELEGWQAIGLNCSVLEILNVKGCSKFGETGLEAIRKGCTNLRVLFLGRSGYISHAARSLFENQRSSVQLLRDDV